jgi:hypothetical protein
MALGTVVSSTGTYRQETPDYAYVLVLTGHSVHSTWYSTFFLSIQLILKDTVGAGPTRPTILSG